MDVLSDMLLIQAYYQAIELDLEHDFIQILEVEMEKRQIDYQLELH